jgi:hypothetical protein
MTFQFDTSGEVRLFDGEKPIVWADFPPFVRGYLTGAAQQVALVTGEPVVRFAWFAPETLEQVLWDCERLAGPHIGEETGERVWNRRQAGRLRTAPPLTPIVTIDGDQGRIVLQEAR